MGRPAEDAARFPHLYSPMELRGQVLRNRILCSPVGLVVAVFLLHGAAQGWVGTLSVVAALFAACRLLDTEDFRRIERMSPSTFNETTMTGSPSGYINATGTPRPEPVPVGPVNTPRQDEIDALNRTWRASSDESP